jgi:hypothetical protein
MGEILQDSESYILQWWDVDYDRWKGNRYYSLKMAKRAMKEMKALDKADGEELKYRIVKETTKQEVVYDESENQD